MERYSSIKKILARLVAFDTTSRNSNLALIHWVEGELAPLGFRTQRVASADGAKANLLAMIGPDVAGGVVLSGHTDVVPVDGQPWTSDPWTLTERDERLYGRGTADMKGFLACVLARAPEMAQARLKRPLLLAFSYDEEVGCLGAPDMIARLVAELPRPAACLVGEPTSMKVVSAHKGIRTFEVTVTGREAHSSQLGQGVSAITEAVKLMALVEAMSTEAQAAADAASPFSPPGATMTVGLVEGGTAVNILARRCAFTWDLRCPDEATAERYEQRFFAAATAADAAIRARAPEGGVLVRRRSRTPALALEPGNAAEELARALTGDNETRAVAFAAEGGLFQRAAIPTVVCGPGDIAQAHQPDEWIAPAQLTACDAMLGRLIARMS